MGDAAPNLRPQSAERYFDQAPISPAMVAARNTGIGLPPSVYRERLARERKILDGDIDLAQKLHGIPIPIRLQQKQLDRVRAKLPPGAEIPAALQIRLNQTISAFSDRRLTWVGDVTGKEINLPMLRDMNIFESVMQRHRAFYLKSLEHFGQTCAGRKFFRYAVITTPARAAAGSRLGDMKSEMMAKISRWQKIIRQRFDIELLLNVVELPFDPDKDRTFFLHFNVMYWPHIRLSAAAWNEFLLFTRQFLGVHWRDCGVVRDYAELLKYVLKSVDRTALKQPEAAWLYGELFRQRFITTYNSFRKTILGLRSKRQKLIYVAEPGGRKRLRIVQLDPKQPGETKDDKQPGEQHKRERETENLIRGRTAPMCRVSAWAEPGTLIEGFSRDPKTRGGEKRLSKAMLAAQEARRWWDANGAPPPATALAVSEAWMCAADDQAAKKISPLNISKNDSVSVLSTHAPGRIVRYADGSGYTVHTTDLTRMDQADEPPEKEPEMYRNRHGPPVTTWPPVGEGDNLIFGRFKILGNRVGEDTGWFPVAELMDCDTGEIIAYGKNAPPARRSGDTPDGQN